MQITLQEALTILHMFGYVEGEGGLSVNARAIVERMLEEFPELAAMLDDDGRPKYEYLT